MGGGHTNQTPSFNVFMSRTMIYMPLVTNLLYILTQIITNMFQYYSVEHLVISRYIYREVPTFNQCSEPWSEGVMD